MNPNAHLTADAAAAPVVDVTTLDFERTVLAESHRRPVVVDFWAPWCGPCRMLGPVLEKLAGQDNGAWLLAKVNTDAEPELGQRFDVRSIPAVKAFRDGAVVAEFVGAQPQPVIERFLASLLPSPADDAATAGVTALEAGDYAKARQHFDNAVALAPRHGRALLGLAQVAAHAGDGAAAEAWLDQLGHEDAHRYQQAIAALRLRARAAGAPADGDALRARVAANPDDHEARSALAAQAAGHGRWDEAFEGWLEVVQRDRGEARGLARKAMVEAFGACPERAILEKWRKRLAMELYV